MKRAVYLSVFVIACGGGGAAIDPGDVSGSPPGPGSSGPPATPAPAPAGAALVTAAGTSFTPAIVTIARGGAVTWQVSGGTHNITFGSLKPSAGDVPDMGPGGSASRTFAAEGTYDYQCTRHSGMTGRVTVTVDGTSPPPGPSPSRETIVRADGLGFAPERVEVQTGDAVTWELAEGAGGIAFEDRAPDGGNIAGTPAAQRVTRYFTAAGDYDYYSTRDRDLKGRVRVR